MSREREDYGAVFGIAFVVLVVLLVVLLAICTALRDDAPPAHAEATQTLPAHAPMLHPGATDLAPTAPQPPRWTPATLPPAEPVVASIDTAEGWTLYGSHEADTAGPAWGQHLTT